MYFLFLLFDRIIVFKIYLIIVPIIQYTQKNITQETKLSVCIFNAFSE